MTNHTFISFSAAVQIYERSYIHLKDDSIDGTAETLAKGLIKKESEEKGRHREHLSYVGGAGHFATDNHGNDIDDDYDDGDAASEYKAGGGVAGGNDGDGDEYDIGGHRNGEGSDNDDHVVGDSGGIGDGCNGDRGGVGGGHVDRVMIKAEMALTGRKTVLVMV